MKNSRCIVSFFLLLAFMAPAVGKAFPLYIPKDDLKLLNRSAVGELDPKNIKVVSWNIFKGKKKGWYHEFHSILRNTSILLVQEYLDSDSVDYTLSTRKQDEVIVGIAYGIRLWGQTGVASISKVSSAGSANFRTKNRENFEIETFKTSLITTYRLVGKAELLMVVNVHMLNSVSPREYEVELRRLSTYIRKHAGPLIIAGDFNSWSSRIEVLNKWAKELKVQEVGFIPDKRVTFKGDTPIDRIFFRGLSLKKSWSGYVKTSDHNPIGAWFEYL